MDNTYNGWTNYATWRINLEIFEQQDLSIEDFEDDVLNFDKDDIADLEAQKDDIVDSLTDRLQTYVEELVGMSVTNDSRGTNLALDYALAFLNDVNWNEIATSMYNDYIDELKEQ